MRALRRRFPSAVLWAFALAALGAAGCGGPMSVRAFTEQAPARPRVAVVQVTVGDARGALQGWNQSRTSEIMASRTAQMLEVAETVLATRFEVVPATSFVASPAYQSVPSAPHPVGVPILGGMAMPTFSPTLKDVYDAVIAPEQAAALCRATGAEYVVVIHSEWGVVTGRMVPTSKAQATTTMSFFDASGTHVARTRLVDRGERTLGAFGRVVVDENSIDEWVGAYNASLQRMLQ